MPNVATVLKSEIARIAKKELRAEITSLKKSQTSFRSDIAALKRANQRLEQAIRTLGKHVQRAPNAPVTTQESQTKTRFSPKSLAAQRQRLGLSAEECGKLIGASGQSVYNWEAGKARPRPAHLVPIAALRSLGRKNALAHLAALQESRSGTV